MVPMVELEIEMVSVMVYGNFFFVEEIEEFFFLLSVYD